MVRSTAAGTWEKKRLSTRNRSTFNDRRHKHRWHHRSTASTFLHLHQFLLCIVFVCETKYNFRSVLNRRLLSSTDTSAAVKLQTRYSKIRLQRASKYWLFPTSNGTHHDIVCFSCFVWETTSWPTWRIVRLTRTFLIYCIRTGSTTRYNGQL